MLSQNKSRNSPFSKKVRVRACGILIIENRILLLKHQSIGPVGYLWSPPGGGVEFGESLHKTLINEFKEETNLNVKVEDYLFANEFMDERHHAIELFFSVTHVSGDLSLGFDPELAPENQILTEAKFFTFKELNQIPKEAIHSAFSAAKARDKIIDLRGLLTFKY